MKKLDDLIKYLESIKETYNGDLKIYFDNEIILDFEDLIEVEEELNIINIF